ncbi:MAG TPA: tetratricopeptide repeat protein [Candidatus Rubrimentiphilum sp.]|nr:tetratricopeptide repeat protein [Candidatus Rubrimentiphilum sp.]
MAVVRIACCLATLVVFNGCAGTVERWILDTRVHQGDVAMARGSLHEAATAYRLALRVNPNDPQARAGFSNASADIADADFRTGNYDDALASINAAQKYDPTNVRLEALRSEIDNARIKREIVLQNYPTYRVSGADIQAAYTALTAQNRLILHSLHRFAYTYDTQDLTRAIEDSYELERDIVRARNRLIAYRQLVQSGVPSTEKGAATSVSGSLLPLP